MTATRGACPTCTAPLVVVPDYSDWCEACGWNADPLAQRSRDGLGSAAAARAMKSVGGRSSAILAREAQSGAQPRITVSRSLAYLVAVLVHLVTVALLVGAFVLLQSGKQILVTLSPLFVGMAWLFRPRARNDVAKVERPQDITHIRSFVDRVAEAVGTKAVDEIALVGEFNAGVTTVGWRQRRVLLLGLPLFAVLEPQERVAVLAHEFGHFVNGDPRRGLLVSSALCSLQQWHATLAPNSIGKSSYGSIGLLMIPVNLVTGMLAQVPLLLSGLLVALVAQDSRRGEYRADAIAARIAGNQAALSAFDKLHLSRMAAFVCSATNANRWQSGSLWQDLQAKTAAFPEFGISSCSHRRQDECNPARSGTSAHYAAYRSAPRSDQPTSDSRCFFEQIRSGRRGLASIATSCPGGPDRSQPRPHPSLGGLAWSLSSRSSWAADRTWRSSRRPRTC